MVKTARRTAGWIIALAVAAAFSLGASELVSGPNAQCDPPYHGSCSSQEECEDLCRVLFPENMGEGVCTPTGCCMCVER
jgi:hypothetical protein